MLRAGDWCVQPVWGQTLALHNASERVYFLPMIAVKAEKDRLEVSIPTEGMTAEEINDLVSWLRVETILRRSKLTEHEIHARSGRLRRPGRGLDLGINQPNTQAGSQPPRQRVSG